MTVHDALRHAVRRALLEVGRLIVMSGAYDAGGRGSATRVIVEPNISMFGVARRGRRMDLARMWRRATGARRAYRHGRHDRSPEGSGVSPAGRREEGARVRQSSLALGPDALTAGIKRRNELLEGLAGVTTSVTTGGFAESTLGQIGLERYVQYRVPRELRPASSQEVQRDATRGANQVKYEKSFMDNENHGMIVQT
jgi:hypothetical protein